MVRWRPRLDSARRIGLEAALTSLLIVVERVMTGGEDVWAEFFTLEMFWLPLPEPEELWPNGGYGWIQHFRLLTNYR